MVEGGRLTSRVQSTGESSRAAGEAVRSSRGSQATQSDRDRLTLALSSALSTAETLVGVRAARGRHAGDSTSALIQDLIGSVHRKSDATPASSSAFWISENRRDEPACPRGSLT